MGSAQREARWVTVKMPIEDAERLCEAALESGDIEARCVGHALKQAILMQAEPERAHP